MGSVMDTYTNNGVERAILTEEPQTDGTNILVVSGIWTGFGFTRKNGKWHAYTRRTFPVLETVAYPWSRFVTDNEVVLSSRYEIKHSVVGYGFGHAHLLPNGDTMDYSESPVRKADNQKREILKRGSDHYKIGGIEPIDFIMANDLDFCAGNVIKYVTRHTRKDTPREDLLKARHYIDFLLERYPDES